MATSKGMLNEVISLVQKDINKRKEENVKLGTISDNGSHLLQMQLDCWLAGINSGFPADWSKYVKQASISRTIKDLQNTSDYAIYLKIKKQIEGATDDE